MTTTARSYPVTGHLGHDGMIAHITRDRRGNMIRHGWSEQKKTSVGKPMYRWMQWYPWQETPHTSPLDFYRYALVYGNPVKGNVVVHRIQNSMEDCRIPRNWINDVE